MNFNKKSQWILFLKTQLTIPALVQIMAWRYSASMIWIFKNVFETWNRLMDIFFWVYKIDLIDIKFILDRYCDVVCIVQMNIPVCRSQMDCKQVLFSCKLCLFVDKGPISGEEIWFKYRIKTPHKRLARRIMETLRRYSTCMRIKSGHQIRIQVRYLMRGINGEKLGLKCLNVGKILTI